jgi:hypothetical protein
LFLRPPNYQSSGSDTLDDATVPPMPGDALTLQDNSPALHRGVDPATVPTSLKIIISDLKKYVYVDIEGRPRAGAPDLGAYQRSVVQ